MGVWKRFTAITKAKTNKVLDRAEDPREMLDLSYQEQMDNLTKVRRAVADVATARKRIEIQADQLKQQGDKLAGQAKAALQQNNESLAREALARREAIVGQLKDLDTQHASVVEQEQKLTETAQRLQAEVESFRTKKETMKASYTAAEAQTKISEAVSGISGSMSDAGAALQRAQEKVAEMQARSGALDELLNSGALTDLTGTTDSIQAQLDKVGTQGAIDAQLEAMKKEIAAAPAAGEIAAAPADTPEVTQ
jgi:phage shock protein A